MFKRLIIVVLVMFAAVPALAQSAPDPINSALADLSNRLGRTVTLTQVTEWNFQQSVYPSPALGCPQPGVSYSDVLTGGFQFIITYDGTVYDYRVSDDKSIVVLCGTAPAPASVPPCPPPNDSAFITPRLTKGVQARVVAAGLPNVIREQPGSSSKLLGQIPPGDPFVVIDGPRCTLLDKIVWWQINYNNLIGWTGEGQDGTYWLEPTDVGLTPTEPAPENVVITTANADGVGIFITTNGPLAVSPDGTLYATTNESAITVANINTQAQAATYAENGIKATSLAFNAAGTVLAAGMVDGEIQVFDLKSGSNTRLQVLTGHTGAVSAVAFNPDGTLIASAGVDKTLRIWNANTGKAISTTALNNISISELTFTANGIYLIARDQNNSNVILAVKTGAEG